MIEFDHIYRQIGKKHIAASFALSLLLDFIALPRPFAYWLPEFTALLLVFWLLHRPQNIGISMAFVIGLLLDIGSGTPLGQHALAFSVAAFIVGQQQRKILSYAFGMQSVAVFGILMLIQLLVVLVYYFYEHHFNSWGLLISPFIGALLWPLLNNLMLLLAKKHRP